MDLAVRGGVSMGPAWAVAKWGTALWLGAVMWLSHTPLLWAIAAEVFASALTVIIWLIWHEHHGRSWFRHNLHWPEKPQASKAGPGVRW